MSVDHPHEEPMDFASETSVSPTDITPRYDAGYTGARLLSLPDPATIKTFLSTAKSMML